MSTTPELQNELRAAISERMDVQAEQLKSERSRLEQRLKEIDQSLEKVDGKRPESTEQELQKILQQAGTARAAVRKQAKPRTTASKGSAVSKESDRPADATRSEKSADTKSKPSELTAKKRSPDKTESKPVPDANPVLKPESDGTVKAESPK